MGRKSLATVRKAEILKHFYEVLVKEGLEGASIAKIAKHMGIYPGHITHYFKNKEEMLIELVESLMKEYAEQLIPQWEKIQDPKKRINKILDMVFSVDWAEFLHCGNHGQYQAVSFNLRADAGEFLSELAILDLIFVLLAK